MLDPNASRRAVVQGLCLTAFLGLASCARPQGDQASPTTPGPVIGPDALVTARGRFVGANGFAMRGGVEIVRTGGRWLIALSEDFGADASPSPILTLGATGYDPAAVLGALRSQSGAQTYALPDGLDIGDYIQVWLWCRSQDRALGVAELQLS